MSSSAFHDAHCNAPGALGRVLMAVFLAVGGVMAHKLPAQAGWTEVKASHNGHFIVEARIDGARTRAVIDTGATVVAIPWREAERMGLKPAFLDFNVPMWTVNGKVMGARVMLRRVEIDSVAARDVQAVVLPKGALGHVLIGMSYLGKLRRYAVNANVMRLVD